MKQLKTLLTHSPANGYSPGSPAGYCLFCLVGGAFFDNLSQDKNSQHYANRKHYIPSHKGNI